MMDPDGDPRWRAGPGHITIDDLVLVGLQRVSEGSWQCHLRLNRPTTSHPAHARHDLSLHIFHPTHFSHFSRTAVMDS